MNPFICEKITKNHFASFYYIQVYQRVGQICDEKPAEGIKIIILSFIGMKLSHNLLKAGGVLCYNMPYSFFGLLFGISPITINH